MIAAGTVAAAAYAAIDDDDEETKASEGIGPWSDGFTPTGRISIPRTTVSATTAGMTFAVRCSASDPA